MSVPKKERIWKLTKKAVTWYFSDAKNWFLLAGGAGLIQTIEKVFINPEVSVSWFLLYTLIMGIIVTFIDVWRN